MKLAAYGLRTLPPASGSAGADTFATELYTRLALRGHTITVYCRKYASDTGKHLSDYRGIRLVHLPTTSRSGFDTLIHSFLATFHIILFNTGKVVHIHNGGNSIWAAPLRLVGKRVFISQDGLDWKREKWSWYARFYLYLSSFFTAYLPNSVIFDNVFVKEIFERRFGRRYGFIPYGSEYPEPTGTKKLQDLGLSPGGYFLFVGRFIPDKGIHYLIEAFEQVNTGKRLVIVGGSPNPDSEYDWKIRSTKDSRIVFPGYLYGDDMLQIMAGAYCYVQPSDVEGLSPVLLTAMGLAKPIICSDIDENIFVVQATALTFCRSDVDSLRERLVYSLDHQQELGALGAAAKERALKEFSWTRVTEQHETLFEDSNH